MTHTRRQLQALLAEQGVTPSRALGQNFVVDPNTVRRIARLAAVGPGDHVIEVGAGAGSLTLALAETGATVVALELDRHVLPVLRASVEPVGRARDRWSRATRWSSTGMRCSPAHRRGPSSPTSPTTSPRRSSSTCSSARPSIGRMLVMVQREAGERLVAEPGSRTYGIPSVRVAHLATARLVGKVGPDVFLPRPRVDSVLVEIVRRPAPLVDADPDRMFELVRTGFGQRRKMLRRSLAGLVPDGAFEAAGIAPTARAEELSVAGLGPAHRRGGLLRCLTCDCAPAKLTVSLRITGVRDDGYHLIDAEMVSLDLADELTFADGDGLEVVGRRLGAAGRGG